MSENSYRTILRSSSVIGAAQLVNIVTNLIKIKFVAVLLGAAGVGLAGLFGSLMQTASIIAGLGFATVGTRQIAAANGEDDAATMARVRRSLMWGTLILALVGGAAVWALRGWLADVALGDPARAGEVGWLALGVALTIAAGSQSALLTGLRRVRDLAMLQVAAGVMAAIIGVLAIARWGEAGVIVMVLVTPAVLFLLGHVFVARLPRAAVARLSVGEFTKEFRLLAALGFAVMISALAGVLSQMLVRVLVQQELGSSALGHFQAAFTISITYLGFVLAAMGTDYFPRLSAAISEPQTATRLVNEQTEVALLLCGPILVTLIGVAPWVVPLLYSADFAPSVDVLRGLLLADILKVISWPLGFVLLASGAGRAYFATELIGASVFVGVTYALLPQWGVSGAGLGGIALYAIYLPVVLWLARGRLGEFSWSAAVIWQAVLVLAAALLVLSASQGSNVAGGVAGLVLGAVTGLWSLLRISHMAELGGRLAVIGQMGQRLRSWLKPRM
jgi:PST family polysaccharide transporter